MGVATQSGYTWTNGNRARILHSGNRLRIKSVTASDEVANFPGDAVKNSLTYDKWIPFANDLSSESNFGTGWTASRVTVASDGQTLAETTDTNTHLISQVQTFTAAEWVLSFQVQRQTVPEIYVRANDGTSLFGAYFDLRDGTVGTQSGATGLITDLGNDVFECRIYFTAASGTGTVAMFLTDGTETTSYTGDTANTIKVLRAVAHESIASLRMDAFGAAAATCFGIAGHNLGDSGGRVSFSHDSNADDTFTSIGAVSNIADNSPIMFFFGSITSAAWRISVSRAVLPEIAVAWVGDPLTMERPLYGGHAPLHMARQTVIRSTQSETGEFVGKTKQRSYGATSFAWQNLTAAWVRTNWRPLQRAIEAEPFFIAWRPESFSEVGFVQTDSVPIPTNQGVRDLMSVEMDVRSLGYD